ncbi:MAG: hypothetical protein WBD53_19790, partial [Xanthobacteraceae bacterium]
MPRRCRLRSVTGLIGLPGAALLLAFVVLVPARAGAQTANDPYDDLLQPSSLPGNPTDPPSFVPPGPGSALPGNPPTGT